MIDRTPSSRAITHLTGRSLKPCTLRRVINFLNVSSGIFVIRRELGRSNIKDESFYRVLFSSCILHPAKGHL